jgi:hypothetical protein
VKQLKKSWEEKRIPSINKRGESTIWNSLQQAILIASKNHTKENR